MLARIEVALAAWRELWRRFGLVAAVGTGACAALSYVNGRSSQGFLVMALLALLGVAVPALAAAGVSRWVAHGPLGLAGRAGRAAPAVAGYGLGAALWALPFALALGLLATRFERAFDAEMVLLISLSLLPPLAWVGSAAGRMVRAPGQAALLALALVAGLGAADAGALYALSALTAFEPVAALGVFLGVPLVGAWAALGLSARVGSAGTALPLPR